MTEAQFRQELKSGLCGVYFLWGAEEYLKRFYAGRAQCLTVSEDGGGLNSFSISASADNACLDSLEEAVYAVSFTGGKVFVKYSFSPSLLSKDEEERLRSICSEANGDYTVLLLIAAADGFDAGKPEKGKPSAAYKFYSGFCKTVDIAVQTPSELKKWIGRRLGADRVAIAADAAELLLSRCGHDMYILSGELDKLAAYALSKGIETIDSDTVTLVSCPHEEEEGFALANALLDGDRRKALRVLGLCRQRREEAVKIMAQIVRAFCDMLAVAALVAEGADAPAVAARMKMHSYRAGLYVSAVRERGVDRIAAALARCREADIQLKSTRLDYIALERFICTIPARRQAK